MTSYEAAVQLEMLAMAKRHGTEIGTLTAELRIIRSTLSAIQPHLIVDWMRTDIADLVDRIDRAIAKTPSPLDEVEEQAERSEDAITPAQRSTQP